MQKAGLNLSDYDYTLPEDRIAQRPAARREDSRLLVSDRGVLAHRTFPDIADYFKPGDCLVLNDTRVIPARLMGRRRTGGRVEVFLLEQADAHTWIATGKPGRALRPGETVLFDRGVTGEVTGADALNGKRTVRFSAAAPDLFSLGRTPLPPYIRREADADDAVRYQTVYAQRPGAVAAPTAGLHFSDALLGRLREKGVHLARVTLHTGMGTFKPISCARVEDHRMEPEQYEVPAAACDTINRTKAGGGRVFAAGTTVAKTLETAARKGLPLTPDGGKSDLFIHPPFEFRAMDALLTNFHMPRSTLLLLVSAFAGRETILRMYGEALDRGYRFLSYGDATLLIR